jgi:hypothetical protein
MIRTARLDHAGRDEFGETIGNELGDYSRKLFDGGRCARLLDVDELVCDETQYFSEVTAISPRLEQIADAGQRIPARLKPLDERESLLVIAPVHADAAPAGRRREEAGGLVLTDGPHRKADPACEFVDRELGVCRLIYRRINVHGVYRVSKYRNGQRRRRRHRH